jgi:hypothetical protein
LETCVPQSAVQFRFDEERRVTQNVLKATEARRKWPNSSMPLIEPTEL